MPEKNFTEWVKNMRSERASMLEDRSEDDPLRFPKGCYEVAFVISPFGQIEIDDLRRCLGSDRPRYSTWPPFSCEPTTGMECRPKTDMIHAWVFKGLADNMSPSTTDYWCLSITGQGYLVRPLEEDDPRDSEQSGLLAFDWVLPAYRMTEVLKFVEWLGLEYSSEGADFQMQTTYKGMKGRSLVNHESIFSVTPAQTDTDIISSNISGQIGNIALNAEEFIFKLLKPVYTQFEFSELNRDDLNEIVKGAISYKG